MQTLKSLTSTCCSGGSRPKNIDYVASIERRVRAALEGPLFGSILRFFALSTAGWSRASGGNRAPETGGTPHSSNLRTPFRARLSTGPLHGCVNFPRRCVLVQHVHFLQNTRFGERWHAENISCVWCTSKDSQGVHCNSGGGTLMAGTSVSCNSLA